MSLKDPRFAVWKGVILILLVSGFILCICTPVQGARYGTVKLGMQNGTPQIGAPMPDMMPSKGDVRLAVFCIEFPDFPVNDATRFPDNESIQAYETRLFSTKGVEGAYPYESLSNYYLRSSYGQINISGAVFGWYRAQYNASYYAREEPNSYDDRLLGEVIDAYNGTVDFRQFDSNADGVIDGVLLVCALPWGEYFPGELGQDIPYAVNRPAPAHIYQVDGVQTRGYIVVRTKSRLKTPAQWTQTVIHETGHLLGLPDYYDHDFEHGDNDPRGPLWGIGGFDMMDQNLGDHNAFSKYLLGWLNPTIVGEDDMRTILRPSSEYPDALLLMPDYTRGSPGEFFMVQYRTPSGNDDDPNVAVPSGIWIWHVDARCNQYGTTIFTNSRASHRLLKLMPADGRDEVESNEFDPDDIFLPGMTFSYWTVPNSARYPNSSGYPGNHTGVFVDSLQYFDSTEGGPSPEGMKVHCGITLQ